MPRTPVRMPARVRRVENCSLTLWAVCWSIPAAVCLGWSPPLAAYVISVAAGVAAFVVDAVARRRTREWFDTVEAVDLRVCPRCHYDLRNIPGTTACPECGAAADADSLRRAWAQAKEDHEASVNAPG